MTTDVSIEVKCKTRGLWRAAIAAWLARRGLRRLAVWLINVWPGVGADLKIGRGRWERGPRARASYGDR